MKIKFNIILLLTITFATITNGQDLKSPSDFLGYEIGTQFSRHYQVLDYFNHIAKSKKNNIILKNYGLTYERRPLFYAVISSENNILNIESIRKSNLSSLDRENKEVNDKSIVWLSYEFTEMSHLQQKLQCKQLMNFLLKGQIFLKIPLLL